MEVLLREKAKRKSSLHVGNKENKVIIKPMAIFTAPKV